LRLVKGDQRAIRQLNRSTILNFLRKQGSLSRVKLKQLSGLSGAAVTGVVAELIRDQLLIEESLGTSTGGRPPVLLAINPQSCLAVGIKLMPDHLTAVLTNISIETQTRIEYPLPDTAPAAVVAAVAATVKSLLKQAGRSRKRPLGVGIGMPGMIDFRHGVCVHSPMLGWRDVPIGAMIEKSLRCPVYVDNDVNAFAEAERLFGRGRQSSNFVVVTIGRGIGSGLVINGRTFRGHRGGAGELGHVLTERDGQACQCGNRGCLEAYASEPAMLRRIKEKAPGKAGQSIDAMLAGAKAGNKIVLEVLRDGGIRVGIAVASLVNLFDPELIVMGGEGMRLGEAFFGPLRESLFAHVFNGLGDDLEVVVEPWDDEAWARGAAGLVVGRTFDANFG
jgi:predicted NBD/HSP70 family sugar kinase